MDKRDEMDKKMQEGERYLQLLDQADEIFESFDTLSEGVEHILDEVECFIESLTEEEIQSFVEDMDESTWANLISLGGFLDDDRSLQDDWRDLGKAIRKYRREEQRGNKAALCELKKTIKELSQNVQKEEPD